MQSDSGGTEAIERVRLVEDGARRRIGPRSGWTGFRASSVSFSDGASVTPRMRSAAALYSFTSLRNNTRVAKNHTNLVEQYVSLPNMHVTFVQQ